MSKFIPFALIALVLGAGAYLASYFYLAPEAQARATGWIDGKCLVIEVADLKPGTPVAITLLDDARTSASATITGIATTPEDCTPLMADRKSGNATEGMAFYTLDGPDTDAVAIGVVGEPNDMPKTVDYCVTGEGIQFTAWTGDAYKSDKLWSGYYYLGYDAEPTCPEE